jgi:hypothetical protein
MVALLVGLGVGLVALGALILLRFPDRPGGAISFHGVEVSSKGAGLPVIVVGAALVVAALVIPATVDPGVVRGSGTSSSNQVGGQPPVPGLDAAPQTVCTSHFFTQSPLVDSARVRSVELGAKDRRVLAVGERQDAEFGMVFSDTLSSVPPRVLGAVKLSRLPGVGFRVSGVVEEQTCQPVGLALASDPGVPAPTALGDYVWVAFRLGGAPYVLLLNSSNANTEVLVTLNRRE